LVPFGELQVDKQTLAWPPEMDVMTVTGFEEALRAAVEVELAANLMVKVASLPGLAILKLFAWYVAAQLRSCRQFRSNDGSRPGLGSLLFTQLR
jgi:predicted nucleotidyltransferase